MSGRGFVEAHGSLSMLIIGTEKLISPPCSISSAVSKDERAITGAPVNCMPGETGRAETSFDSGAAPYIMLFPPSSMDTAGGLSESPIFIAGS